ncbi:coiled-coil and C2 domain-containing protein 1A [Stigmatopora argus]
MSGSRNPPPRGQGAARARQMGLLLDLNPDDGGMDDDVNDEDLEAELHNLMGGGNPQRKKRESKAPVPIADIERMAALCMKDLDEEDMEDDDLENDEDLLAELNDVLEDEEQSSPAHTLQPHRVSATSQFSPVNSSGAAGSESRILERIEMYKGAISNATASGESSKARRYDRGLKTLQSMLTSVRKGKPINEDEMPPPVAVGGKPSAATESESTKEQQTPEPVLIPYPPFNQKPVREAEPAAHNTKPVHLAPPQSLATASTPGTPMISPLTPCQPGTQHSELKQAVLSRQREYKLAALQAKQTGNIGLAKKHYVTAKNLDSLVEAVDRSEPVDLSLLPPSPGDVIDETQASPSSKVQTATTPTPTPTPPPPHPPEPSAGLPAPSNLAEALQQRMDIYKLAANGAKNKGDERKSRMHQRIVKQYQDSIKAHKAGRPVNLSDLPVPPGCPPLQGSESDKPNFMGVLETAMKIANQDPDAEDEDTPKDMAKPSVLQPAQKAKSPASQAPSASTLSKLGGKAQQQVDFLLLRRQAFLRAALHSKKMKDMTAAAQHLRHVKGLDPMIEAAKSGLLVDISKIPQRPVSEDEYLLARSRTSLSPHTSEQYHGLMDLLRKQHEECVSHSQQFIKMSIIGEALKSEKLIEESLNTIEMLKNAHTKGQPVPKYRTEEKIFTVVKNYPNLAPNDMILYIIRGINLPVPSGVSPNDLDASVKFEFPFPSVEEAQRDKTTTVKSTSSPEFKEQFKLNINRTHRGFKRVIQSKGFKFEIIHKGGLFKTDKIVGTAQLKLDALENRCDIREIIEVMDGRKATGGKLEVRVKIREPISGVELHSTTEKWLKIEPVSELSPPEKQKERAPSPRSKPRHDGNNRSSHSSSSPPQYKLHSFSLLNYDKDRLEKKIVEYQKNRRDPPPDVIHQYKEITHRLQWQKAQLERASASQLSDYENVLWRFTQGLADSVKKFSSQGNRDAAKDALGRLKMVEAELESLKRKRAG